MTLYESHVLRWKDCTDCILHENRQHVVLARGSLPCEILFCGEAPGRSEDVIGKPFIGPAGRLLESIIAEAFDPRPRIAFTNLVACIPLGDENEKLAAPDHKEIKACTGRLKELVRMAEPRLIVCVGKLARTYIVGQAQFCEPGKDNQPPWLADCEPLEFVEIVHPAHILRSNLVQRGLMRQRAVVVLRNAWEELR